MGVGEAAGNPAGDEHREFHREDALLVLDLLHELLKVDSPNQFHGDENHAARFTQVIRLNDVRVNQVRNELRFTDKIVDEHPLVGIILADDLDSDAFYE